MNKHRNAFFAVLVFAVVVAAWYGVRSLLDNRSVDIPHHIPVETTASRDEFRLASWNVRIFSDESRDDTEIRYIAQTLADYDFIAIVELRDETVLRRTEKVLEEMGRNYDYQISPPVGRKVKERYAFVYDPSLVDVITEGQLYPDPNDVFIREPYYASFRAGQFDFTIIATHVIWGKRVADRRAEILRLGEVYRAIQNANPEEQVLASREAGMCFWSVISTVTRMTERVISISWLSLP